MIQNKRRLLLCKPVVIIAFVSFIQTDLSEAMLYFED